MSSEAATNFIFCLLSEQITSSLSEIANIFYDSSWYRAPMRYQKLFPLVIARSQQAFHLRGLGIISCSLETFARVIFIFFPLDSKNYWIFCSFGRL